MGLLSLRNTWTASCQTASSGWARVRAVCVRAEAGGRPVARRVFLTGAGLATALVAVPDLATAASPIEIAKRQGEVRKSDEEWQRELSPEAYRVLRREATERRWTSELNYEKRPGVFRCAGCGAGVFNASAKFESGTGWPSFYEPVQGAVAEVPDLSIPFMPRTEVRCQRCQGHLGHVFDDGPRPTGLRYCINGVALKFEPLQA